jgi:ATP-binding cassette subfamily F protein 3
VAWKERMAKQKMASTNSQTSSSPVVEKSADSNVQPKTPSATQAGAVDKEKKKELQKAQKRFEQVERSLAEWQEKKQQLELKLSDPGIYASKDVFLDTEAAFTQANQQIDLLNKEYEQLFEKIMNAADNP